VQSAQHGCRSHEGTRSIDTEVQPSRCVQIPREGRVHRDPVRCADARRCSEQPTRAGSSADAPRTVKSSSPSTRAGSCRSPVRRSRSPWGSRTVSAAPRGPTFGSNRPGAAPAESLEGAVDQEACASEQQVESVELLRDPEHGVLTRPGRPD